MTDPKQDQPTETTLPTPAKEAGEASNPGEALPRILPVLPVSDVVLFPGMIAPLIVSTAKSIKLIDDVVAGNRTLITCLQRSRDAQDDGWG